MITSFPFLLCIVIQLHLLTEPDPCLCIVIQLHLPRESDYCSCILPTSLLVILLRLPPDLYSVGNISREDDSWILVTWLLVLKRVFTSYSSLRHTVLRLISYVPLT